MDPFDVTANEFMVPMTDSATPAATIRGCSELVKKRILA